MNALIPTAGDGLSMTSLEIASLVEKRHDNVKRTIETLAERGTIQLPQIEETEKINNLGLPQRTSVYRFSGERGKRDSIIVVAQLCPEFTARLVDRWQALEQQLVFAALPDFTSPAAAARAWAEQVEQREKLALENKAQAETLAEQAPKVQVFLRMDSANSCACSTSCFATSTTSRSPSLGSYSDGEWRSLSSTDFAIFAAAVMCCASRNSIGSEPMAAPNESATIVASVPSISAMRETSSMRFFKCLFSASSRLVGMLGTRLSARRPMISAFKLLLVASASAVSAACKSLGMRSVMRV